MAFLDDRRIKMDTDTVGRVSRPITQRRKNALFAGSDSGARHWSIVMTLLQTAKMNGLEPITWLTDLLERIVSGQTKSQAAQPGAIASEVEQTNSSEHHLSGHGCPLTDDLMRRPQLLLSRRVVLTAIATSVLFEGSSISAGRSATRVLVVPSLHKRLAANSRYSYADLYSVVAAFQPDLVGVEIRQEDLARADPYLNHNYPEEMVTLAQAYKHRVFGFDWLGWEVEGRSIPSDWWTKQSPIKQLERSCGSPQPTTSPRLLELNARLDEISQQQEQIVGSATAASLSDGRYDRVTAEYYKIAAELTRGTRCERLTDWYAERDHEISANIVKEVLKNPGRRIAVVTGCGHHGPVIAALTSLGSAVELVAVRNSKRSAM